MTIRILIMLLGIITGFGIWLNDIVNIKQNQDIEYTKLRKQIERIEYNEKKEYIEKKKKELIAKELLGDEFNISNLDQNKNVLKEIQKKTQLELKKEENKKRRNFSNIKLTIYDYNDLYKKIYNTVVNNDKVKDKIGYKDFKNTFLYKRIQELKEQVIHSKLNFIKSGKELNFDYLIVDIKCNGFCKKKINREINEVYQLNKNIIRKIKVQEDLTEQQILDFLKSEESFYDYFNKKNKNDGK